MVKVRTDLDALDRLRPTLRYECNLQLLDYLLTYRTRRAVTILRRRYLELIRKSDRDCMYLPLTRKGEVKPHFPASKEMVEFYTAFDGLRESVPPYCGDFIRCREVATLSDDWSANEIAGYMEDLPPKLHPGWMTIVKCPIIFVALNGDSIIQTPDGKFRWWILSEARMKKVADTFSQFLRHYVEYRIKHAGVPFDSYGPP